MIKTTLLTSLFCALPIAGTLRAAEAQQPGKPNILIILTDDQGYADLGANGADGDVRTPNLDQLAGEGVLFTNGYTTAPQCVPSRAGIISCRHQNAFGLEDNLKGPLAHDEYTIAERLLPPLPLDLGRPGTLIKGGNPDPGNPAKGKAKDHTSSASQPGGCPGVPWPATDGLGRTLPLEAEAGPPKPNRTVGIFYFPWLEGKSPVYDITKLLSADPAAPAYGPVHAFHFWGEPLFGYYRSDDESVIRKHAQMLADAAVDVLFFDVTNALTYDDTCRTLCRVFTEMRNRGERTPQIAFLANTKHEKVVDHLMKTFYSANLHPDLWFRWKGKPLLLTPGDRLPAGTNDFFSIRHSWAWSAPNGWFGDGRDKWPWLDHTPQKFGWHESPEQAEELPVAVAEHPIANIGRSFHDGIQPPPEQTESELGLYFNEQWTRALEVDPELVFVTGWNEWIAQRFLKEEGKAPNKMCGKPLQPGDTFFVDAFNQEFSRDIEPMKGGHGDNYYYQLVNFIRRYKGVPALPAVAGGPVAIDGRFDDWRAVTPEFSDTLGDPVRRNHPGWKGQPNFVNTTGRNDLASAKVSRDDKNIYFYARTADPLTPRADQNWMLLFIDADQNPKTGWLGYDFVVNRTSPDATTAALERNLGGYRWGDPVSVPCRTEGNEIELNIPSDGLKIPPGAGLDFKWADNIQQTGEWSDFTLNGDAAPNDRFNFRAILCNN